MDDTVLPNPVVELRNSFESLPTALRRPIEMVVFGGELPRADISGMRRMAAEFRAKAADLGGVSDDAKGLLEQEDSVGVFGDRLRETLGSHRDGAARLRDDAVALADQAQAAANDAEKTLCVMFAFGIELAWRIFSVLTAAAAAGPGAEVAAVPVVESMLVEGRGGVAVMRAGLEQAFRAKALHTAARLSTLGPLRLPLIMARAAVLPVGVDAGVQALQVRSGDRTLAVMGADGEHPTGIDRKSLEVAALSAAGGVAGGMAAGRLAPTVLPRIEGSRLALGLVHGIAGAVGGLGAAASLTGWPEHFDQVLAPLLNGGFAGAVHAHAPAHPATVTGPRETVDGPRSSVDGSHEMLDGSGAFTAPDLPVPGRTTATALPPIEVSAQSKRAWAAAKAAWTQPAAIPGAKSEAVHPVSEPIATDRPHSPEIGAPHTDPPPPGTPVSRADSTSPADSISRSEAGNRSPARPDSTAARTDAAVSAERSPAGEPTARPGTAAPRTVTAAGETAPPPKISSDIPAHRPDAGRDTSATGEHPASSTPEPHDADGIPDRDAVHHTADTATEPAQSGEPEHGSDPGTGTVAHDTGAHLSDAEPGTVTHDTGEQVPAGEGADSPSARDRAVDTLAEFHAGSDERIPEQYRLHNLPDDVLQAGLFDSDAGKSMVATMEIIRRGTTTEAHPAGMVLRVEQAEGVYALAQRPVEMKPGEGKSLMFMAAAIQRAVRHDSCLLVTTTDGLAYREYTKYRKLLSDYGIDVYRADQQSGFGPVAAGRPAIVVATGETVGHLCNAGHEPPRHALIDEMDGIIDRGDRQFIRSEGVEHAASEATAAEVFAAHDFLADALHKGTLSHQDFGLTRITEEVGTHPDGTPEVQFWYDGQAELTSEGRAKVEALPSGKHWLDALGSSRLETAAAAEFTTRNKTHYVMDAGKIVIVDQGEHGLQRNPVTSSESRWSAEPGKASLAQAVEAKEIRAAEAIGMSAEQHRIVVRADAENAKDIDAVRIYGKNGGFFDTVTGASGTLADLNPVLDKIYGLQEAHEVDRSQTHRLIEGAPEVVANTRAKLDAIAGYAHRMWDGGEGRFQEILCHRNDLVDRQVAALVREGVPRDAIEAVDADRIAGWGADWEAQLQKVFDEAGEQGKILVINRQGQRGVDISVSEDVQAKGGMHVWMTEVPEQSYVHEQATNRTARNGDRGFAQALVSPQDALIRNAMHLHGVREAVVRYDRADTAHRADPTPEHRNDLVDAGDRLRALVPDLQERALRRTTADFISHYAQTTANPAATLAAAATRSYTNPADADRPDRVSDQAARLAGLLGIPISAVTSAADMFGDDDADGSPASGPSSSAPIRGLLEQAGLSRAAVEALQQQVEETAPATVAQYATLNTAQELDLLAQRRDRLAAILGEAADLEGAEGMRTIYPALAAARGDLAQALGYPVSAITPAIARDILGELVGHQLPVDGSVRPDAGGDSAAGDRVSMPVAEVAPAVEGPMAAAPVTASPVAEDIVAAASQYLATAALLELVVTIHRRSPNSCVNNAVTGVRVLTGRNVEMPSYELGGHNGAALGTVFRAPLVRAESLDQVAESLTSRPGGIACLVYKWKDTAAQNTTGTEGDKPGTTVDADDHLVLVVNDSEPGEAANLVVVDLAASRSGDTSTDYTPKDLRNRRALLDKAVPFDTWREKQAKYLNKLGDKQSFQTLDLDRDGNPVLGFGGDIPAAETLPPAQRVAVDVDTEREIDSIRAGAPDPLDLLLQTDRGESDLDLRDPSRRSELAPIGSRPYDIGGGRDDIDDVPGTAAPDEVADAQPFEPDPGYQRHRDRLDRYRLLVSDRLETALHEPISALLQPGSPVLSAWVTRHLVDRHRLAELMRIGPDELAADTRLRHIWAQIDDRRQLRRPDGSDIEPDRYVDERQSWTLAAREHTRMARTARSAAYRFAESRRILDDVHRVVLLSWRLACFNELGQPGPVADARWVTRLDTLTAELESHESALDSIDTRTLHKLSARHGFAWSDIRPDTPARARLDTVLDTATTQLRAALGREPAQLSPDEIEKLAWSSTMDISDPARTYGDLTTAIRGADRAHRHETILAACTDEVDSVLAQMFGAPVDIVTDGPSGQIVTASLAQRFPGLRSPAADVLARHVDATGVERFLTVKQNLNRGERGGWRLPSALEAMRMQLRPVRSTVTETGLAVIDVSSPLIVATGAGLVEQARWLTRHELAFADQRQMAPGWFHEDFADALATFEPEAGPDTAATELAQLGSRLSLGADEIDDLVHRVTALPPAMHDETVAFIRRLTDVYERAGIDAERDADLGDIDLADEHLRNRRTRIALAAHPGLPDVLSTPMAASILLGLTDGDRRAGATVGACIEFLIRPDVRQALQRIAENNSGLEPFIGENARRAIDIDPDGFVRELQRIAEYPDGAVEPRLLEMFDSFAAPNHNGAGQAWDILASLDDFEHDAVHRRFAEPFLLTGQLAGIPGDILSTVRFTGAQLRDAEEFYIRGPAGENFTRYVQKVDELTSSQRPPATRTAMELLRTVTPEFIRCIRRLMSSGTDGTERRLLGLRRTGTAALSEIRVVAGDFFTEVKNANISAESLAKIQTSDFLARLLLDITHHEKNPQGSRTIESLRQLLREHDRAVTAPHLDQMPAQYRPSAVVEVRKPQSRRHKPGRGWTQEQRIRFARLAANVQAARRATMTERRPITHLLDALGHDVTAHIATLEHSIAAGGANAVAHRNMAARAAGLTELIAPKEQSTTTTDGAPLFPALRSLADFERNFLRLARVDELHDSLRTICFAWTMQRHPEWVERLRSIDPDAPTVEDITLVREFIGQITNEDVFAQYFSDPKGARVFRRMTSVAALDDAISRTRGVGVASDTTALRFVPTRGPLLELSGHIGAAAMPNMTAVVMVRNPGAPGRTALAGSALLIETTSASGEPVLLIRGLNPQLSFLRHVAVADFYRVFTDWAHDIAAARGRRLAIVIDAKSGDACTNRPDLFTYLDAMRGDLTPVRVDPEDTTFNGHEVSRQCYLVEPADTSGGRIGSRPWQATDDAAEAWTRHWGLPPDATPDRIGDRLRNAGTPPLPAEVIGHEFDEVTEILTARISSTALESAEIRRRMRLTAEALFIGRRLARGWQLAADLRAIADNGVLSGTDLRDITTAMVAHAWSGLADHDRTHDDPSRSADVVRARVLAHGGDASMARTLGFTVSGSGFGDPSGMPMVGPPAASDRVRARRDQLTDREFDSAIRSADWVDAVRRQTWSRPGAVVEWVRSAPTPQGDEFARRRTLADHLRRQAASADPDSGYRTTVQWLLANRDLRRDHAAKARQIADRLTTDPAYTPEDAQRDAGLHAIDMREEYSGFRWQLAVDTGEPADTLIAALAARLPESADSPQVREGIIHAAARLAGRMESVTGADAVLVVTASQDPDGRHRVLAEVDYARPDPTDPMPGVTADELRRDLSDVDGRIDVDTADPLPDGRIRHRARIDLTRQRILVRCSHFGPGGTGMSTVNEALCAGLAAAGHEVTVWASTATKGFTLPGVTLYNERIQGLSRPGHHLPNVVPRSVDMVIGHADDQGLGSVLSARKHYPAAKFVSVQHLVPMLWAGLSNSPGRGRAKLAARIYLARQADLVTGLGPMLALDALSTASMAGHGSVHELRPSVEMATQPPQPDAGSPATILLFGRAGDRLKGVGEIAEVVRQLRTQGRDVRLVVRGYPDRGVDAAHAGLARTIGDPEAVQVRPFTTSRTELTDDIRAATVVVMPSRAEGFGTVVTEAIEQGVPVAMPASSGAGQFLAELADYRDTARRFNLVDQELGAPVPIESWVTTLDSVLADLPGAWAAARELQSSMRPYTRENSARRLVHAVRNTDTHPRPRLEGLRTSVSVEDGRVTARSEDEDYLRIVAVAQAMESDREVRDAILRGKPVVFAPAPNPLPSHDVPSSDGLIGSRPYDESQSDTEWSVWIRKGRLQLRSTQEQLAREVGVRKSTISRYEAGKQKPPLDTFERICRAFRLDDEATNALVRRFYSAAPRDTHVGAHRLFGDWLRALRKSKGMNQSELARAIGVSSASISGFERGQRPLPGVFLRILRVLEVEGPEQDAAARKFYPDISFDLDPAAYDLASCGRWIAALRYDRDMLQSELASRVGITSEYLSVVESGKQSVEPVLLRRLCVASNVAPEVVDAAVGLFHPDLALGLDPAAYDLASCGRWIAALRYDRDMLRTELAQAAGITSGSLALIESGEQSLDPVLLRRLCLALNVAPEIVDTAIGLFHPDVTRGLDPAAYDRTSRGRWFTALRYDRDMLPYQLASRVGMTSAYLALIESGKRSPEPALLRRLCLALNVAPDIVDTAIGLFHPDLALGLDPTAFDQREPGRWIAALRQDRGSTRHEIDTAIGLRAGATAAIEAGSYRPKYTVFTQICDALGVTNERRYAAARHFYSDIRLPVDPATHRSPAAWITALREDCRMSLADLAGRSSMTVAELTAIESGEDLPTLSDLRRIRTAMGVPDDFLLKALARFYSDHYERSGDSDEQELFERHLLSPVGSDTDYGSMVEIRARFGWIADALLESRSWGARSEVGKAARMGIGHALADHVPSAPFAPHAWAWARDAILAVPVDPAWEKGSESAGLEYTEPEDPEADFAAKVRAALADTADPEIAERLFELHVAEGVPLAEVARQSGLTIEDAQALRADCFQRLRAAFDPRRVGIRQAETVTVDHSRNVRTFVAAWRREYPQLVMRGFDSPDTPADIVSEVLHGLTELLLEFAERVPGLRELSFDSTATDGRRDRDRSFRSDRIHFGLGDIDSRASADDDVHQFGTPWRRHAWYKFVGTLDAGEGLSAQLVPMLEQTHARLVSLALVDETWSQWLHRLSAHLFVDGTDTFVDAAEALAAGFVQAKAEGELLIGTPQWAIYEYVSTEGPPEIPLDFSTGLPGPVLPPRTGRQFGEPGFEQVVAAGRKSGIAQRILVEETPTVRIEKVTFRNDTGTSVLMKTYRYTMDALVQAYDSQVADVTYARVARKVLGPNLEVFEELPPVGQRADAVDFLYPYILNSSHAVSLGLQDTLTRTDRTPDTVILDQHREVLGAHAPSGEDVIPSGAFAARFARWDDGRPVWLDHGLPAWAMEDMRERLTYIAAWIAKLPINADHHAALLDRHRRDLAWTREIERHAAPNYDDELTRAGIDDKYVNAGAIPRIRAAETFALKYPYLTMAGFDHRDVVGRVVQQILGALDEMLTRFPDRTDIRELRLDYLGDRDADAETIVSTDPATAGRTVRMVFNLRKAIDSRTTAGTTDDPTFYIDAIQEFVHAMDVDPHRREAPPLSQNLHQLLDRTWQQLTELGLIDEPRHQWLARLPERAFTDDTAAYLDNRTALAAGFAETEVYGALTGTPQWMIHEYVTTGQPPRITPELDVDLPPLTHPVAPDRIIGSRTPGGVSGERDFGEPGFGDVILAGLNSGVTKRIPGSDLPGVQRRQEIFGNRVRSEVAQYDDPVRAFLQVVVSWIGNDAGARVTQSVVDAHTLTVYSELAPAPFEGHVWDWDRDVLNSESAYRIGLVDAVTRINRTAEQWRQDLGGVVVGTHAEPDPGTTPSGDFAARYVENFGGREVWLKHPLPKQVVAAVREAAPRRRAEIESFPLSRQQRDQLLDFYDACLVALEQIERNAVQPNEPELDSAELEAAAENRSPAPREESTAPGGDRLDTEPGDGPAGLIGSRPYEDSPGERAFGGSGFEELARAGLASGITERTVVANEPGVRIELMICSNGFRMLGETYADPMRADIQVYLAKVATTIGAPIGCAMLNLEDGRVYRELTPDGQLGNSFDVVPPGILNSPSAILVGLCDAATGTSRTEQEWVADMDGNVMAGRVRSDTEAATPGVFAARFVQRIDGREVWLDNDLPRSAVENIRERVTYLESWIEDYTASEKVRDVLRDRHRGCVAALVQIERHAVSTPAETLHRAGLDKERTYGEVAIKARLAEDFALKYPFLTLVGFDNPQVGAYAVAEIVGALDDMFTRFRDRTNIREVRFDYLGDPNAGAMTFWDPDREASAGRTFSMQFNLRHAARPDRVAEFGIRARELGLNPIGDRPFHHDAVHEFIHAIDAKEGLSANLGQILFRTHEQLSTLGLIDEHWWTWFARLPQYAFGNKYKTVFDNLEALAIGFTETDIHGAPVGSPQWAIHEYVTTGRPPRVTADLDVDLPPPTDSPESRGPDGLIGSRPFDDAQDENRPAGTEFGERGTQTDATAQSPAPGTPWSRAGRDRSLPTTGDAIGSRPYDPDESPQRPGPTPWSRQVNPPPDDARHTADPMPDPVALTALDIDILARARQGMTHNEIAVVLDRSEREVRANLAGIRRKIRNQQVELMAASSTAGQEFSASDQGRFQAAMYSALLGADEPDPRQLVAEAGAEQVEGMVRGLGSAQHEALRKLRAGVGDAVTRTMALMAARRVVSTLAADHDRAIAAAAAVLADADAAEIRAALDHLSAAERQLVTRVFDPATPPAAFEPDGSARHMRAVGTVRRIATHMATDVDPITADGHGSHDGVQHGERHARGTRPAGAPHPKLRAAQTFTADDCLDALLPWIDLPIRSEPGSPSIEDESATGRTKANAAYRGDSLPVDHGFDGEQQRLADSALRMNDFGATEMPRPAGYRLSASGAGRRATENGLWWNSLSAPEAPGTLSMTQQALIQVYPHRIGNAEGIPATIRDHANRLSISRDLAEFVARRPADGRLLAKFRTELTPAESKQFSNLVLARNHLREMDRRAAAEIPGSPPVHLLSFDATAFAGKGKAIVALGNVDTAHTVNWHVPGTTTTSASLAYQFTPLRNVYEETKRVDPSLELATVIWIGYDAPTGQLNTGYVKAAFRERARIGGERLLSDLAAFQAARRLAGTASPDRLAIRLSGHSYGSTVIGYAGRDRRLAGVVVSITVTGSPGMGPMHSAAEFGIGAENIFVAASWRDLVTIFGADSPRAWSRMYKQLGLGLDPSGVVFAANRIGAEFPDTPSYAGTTAIHQGYLHYDPDTGVPTEALLAMAQIIAGWGHTLDSVDRRRPGNRVVTHPADAERGRYADHSGPGDPSPRSSGEPADEVQAARGATTGAEERGRLLIEDHGREAGRPATRDGRADGDQAGLPAGMTGLLDRVRATGADAGTTARTERAVLDRYQEQCRARGRTLRQEFLNNKSHELRERGETADAADAAARSQVDEYLRGERAQHLIRRDAAARTTEWADKIELPQVLDEVGASPRALGPQHVDDMLQRLATRGEQAEQLPKGLQQAVTRIENSGADERAIADAKRLLHDRYHDYRRPPMAHTYRETLLEQRAEFARHGFPPHVADRLAQRRTEAFTQTAKAQRMIDSVAANNTSQWFTKMQAEADRDGVDIADRLAETHRYEQQPLSEPELRAAGERIAAMLQRLDGTQQQLDALLDRSPELAEKGTDRWQAGIDTHREIVTRFSDTVQSRTETGETVIRRIINDATLQGPEAGIRGYEGEIQMAHKLDNIHDLGPLVDVSTPTGVRMASEVDIVTDQGRVWHEVKTTAPAFQRSHQRDLEAQARRQLAISHMNREYWVEGKPPELKMHFMNGVHPTVKSRIEALRIEDENGHIVQDHRVEVIDES